MKRIKMVLYAEPGVGKSVFASKAPKPFFICTDGNYEWLEEFGADPKAHINVTSWSEIRQVINKPETFNGFETIVLDLTEDAFKWCESEYCIRNKIEHLSDLGYGKAYDATRNEFFIEICKLFAMDKHVILIMHGLTRVVKDRRGVEHTEYIPTNRIPDKVLDMIEGRVRYFLRAYLKDEEKEDGTVIKRRWLSVVPKPGEFGIIRGVDENKIPQDIPLEWSEFAKVIGLDVEAKVETKVETPVEEKPHRGRKKQVEEPAPKVEETPVITDTDTVEDTAQAELTTNVEDNPPWEEPAKEEPKPEPKPEPVPTPAPQQNLSNADKLAAIRAKLAAIKK